VKIYTKRGDDGTTGLLFGGRVEKASDVIEANGCVDEAQASLGWARSLADGEIAAQIVECQRDLWILMAEVASAPDHRDRLEDGRTRVSPDMVQRLEDAIDRWTDVVVMPDEFVVPGETQLSAALDVARTVVRRAERAVVRCQFEESLAVNYLNRLSDLAWTLARVAEGPSHRVVRSVSTKEST
jgi:cob(I)alamin adenosyltransferase